jgi:alanine racemase
MVRDRVAQGGSAVPIEARLAAAGLPSLPRLAWLEVDLDILVDNARALRRLLPPATTMGVVVKADGYGHGLEMAARAAIAGGAGLLVVATLDEALVLRDARLHERILVIYPVPPPTIPTAVEAGLDVVVADDASVDALAAYLRGLDGGGGGASRAGGTAGGRPGGERAGGERAGGERPEPRVHLGIDTGMGRGGVAPEVAPRVARRLLEAGLAGLAGTWSHLASPEDPAAVARQVDRFEAALAAFAAAGIEPGSRHLDATGGVLAGVAPAYDLVRIGLAFYGVLPPEVALPREIEATARDLRPALTLHARATLLTPIAAGARVGYGGTWTATRPSIVATLALGYADGWVRAYAPGSWGIARGRRVPVIGRVSSDAIALDVTDVPGFGMDDEIVLLGDDGAAMSVLDLAALRRSIPWEVLDGFGARLSRVYLRGGRAVGARYADGRTRLVAE